MALLLSAVVMALPARAGRPERVIAVGGAITEIVYALDAQDRLVAVDSTSTHPPAAADLPGQAALSASLEALVGAGFAAMLAPVLDHWAEAGLITPRPDGFALTPAGWFWQANLIVGLQEMLTLFHGGPAGPSHPRQEPSRHARHRHHPAG